MKKEYFSAGILLTLLLVTFFSLEGCRMYDYSSGDEPSGSANKLIQGQFSIRNYTLLERLIAKFGKNAPDYNEKSRPYVVCDWDNTSAFNDAEETLSFYMLDNLSYKLSVRGATDF
ncbi:MAG: hypothetical protein WA705_04375 [Candidatus Ozemobacteraceae bacterium]